MKWSIDHEIVCSSNKNAVRQYVRMKTKLILGVAILAVSTFTGNSVHAATVYNDTQTFIAGGGGNPDGGWVTDSNAQYDISASSRWKDRSTGDVSNTAGVYDFALGDSANWEFSLNSGEAPLSSFDWYVALDTNAGLGTTFTTFNLATIPDNSFGDESTGAAMGVEGPWATLAPLNEIAQNSHRERWYGIDWNVQGLYDLHIFATEIGAGPDGERLVDAFAQAQFGDPQVPTEQPVPEPATYVGALILGGLIARRMRRKA